MKYYGWRKPTPDLYDVEKHFEAGDRVSVPKSQSIFSIRQSKSMSCQVQWTNDSIIEGRVQ